ncbi:MAG: hypothetical protein WCF94_00505 [bacterium]
MEENTQTNKGSKLTIAILLIICAIALIVWGGLYLKTKQIERAKISANGQQLTEEKYPGWLSVENTNYGLVIKHPADWMVENLDNNKIRIVDTKQKPRPDTGDPRDSVAVNKDINCIDSDWTVGYGLLEYKDICYKDQSIKVTLAASSAEYKKIEQEIIDSLKFSSKKLSDGWKAYVNDEYGFEFKYPAEWKVVDSSKTIITERYPSVTIESPARNDLEGFKGTNVSYRIMFWSSSDGLNSPGGVAITHHADFGSSEKPAQSWWNIEVPNSVKNATEEFKIGEKIIDSFIKKPAAAITNQTADWTTYTDSQLMISFKHPQNWIVRQVKDTLGATGPSYVSGIAIYANEVPITSKDFISIGGKMISACTDVSGATACYGGGKSDMVTYTKSTEPVLINATKLIYESLKNSSNVISQKSAANSIPEGTYGSDRFGFSFDYPKDFVVINGVSENNKDIQPEVVTLASVDIVPKVWADRVNKNETCAGKTIGADKSCSVFEEGGLNVVVSDLDFETYVTNANIIGYGDGFIKYQGYDCMRVGDDSADKQITIYAFPLPDNKTLILRKVGATDNENFGGVLKTRDLDGLVNNLKIQD